MNRPDIKIGTILEYSIGCGCDEYWQVVSRTPKTLTARRIEYKIVKRYPKFQSMDIAPIKDAFREPEMRPKYLGSHTEDGRLRFKDADINTVKLKIAEDGKIGPSVRMMWWSVYDGKAKNQYSP